MNILILGAGQVGSSLAKDLIRYKDNNITIIDKSRKRLSEIKRSLDVKLVEGIASYTTTLEAADITNMDLVIAVTESDECNMIACQIAHTLYGVTNKISRIRASDYLHREELFSDNAIPINFVITPEKIVTKFIMRIIEIPGAYRVLEFENGLVNLVSTMAFTGTPIVGVPIKHLHQHLPKTHVRIVHIIRNDNSLAISGDTIVEDGDEVYFLAEKKSITKILREFRIKDKRYKRIMIAGGGIVGLNLALELEHKYNIHIVELNEERVKEIADKLNHATVLQGNASDEVLLLEEGINKTDLFIAVTDSDETNVLVSILAKQLGAYKTVALVKRDIYEDLARQSSHIDVVVSPDQVTVSEFLSYIKRKEAMIVYQLQGNYEAIEMIVNSNNKMLINKTIKNIKLPEKTKIGCLVRDSKVIMGSGDVEVKENDHVILISDIKNSHTISKLFNI